MTKLFIFLLLLLVFSQASAQYRPDTTVYKVELRDGNLLRGKIIGEYDGIITFQTTLGVIHIPKSEIRKMEAEVSKADFSHSPGHFLLNSSNYFNLPSGYGMGKGEVLYKNSMLFINHLSYGISDQFSLGAGTIPLFALGSRNSPFWITPKISIPLVPDRINLGITGFVAGITGLTRLNSVVQTTLTLGTRERNISAGFTFGYLDRRPISIPVTNISGMLRISENHHLMGESYFSQDFILAFAGGRWLFDYVTMDYGLAISSAAHAYFGFPWIGFLVPFQVPKH